MEKCKILKLDLHSKLIYLVMHFIWPVAVLGALGWSCTGIFEDFPIGWLVSVFGIILGLYFSIDGIIKYGKYAIISENTLMVCKGNVNSPKVIQKYNIKESKFSISKYGINTEVEGKSVPVLYLKANPIFNLIFTKALMTLAETRGDVVCRNILNKIIDYEKADEEIKKEKQSCTNSIALWMFNGFITIIAFVVLVITLVYSFFLLIEGKIAFHGFKHSFNESKIVKYYDEDIKNDPNNPELYWSRAIFQKDKDAVKDLDKAIELDPKYVKAYISRGFVKDRLEDYNGAIADCNKALELDPKNYEAYICLGAVKTDQGEYELADSYLDKAVEIDPENEEAYFYKWMLYEEYKPDEWRAMHKKYKELQEKNELKDSKKDTD